MLRCAQHDKQKGKGKSNGKDKAKGKGKGKSKDKKGAAEAAPFSLDGELSECRCHRIRYGG